MTSDTTETPKQGNKYSNKHTEIDQLYKSWQQSGKTQKAYCVSNGITFSTFKGRLHQGRQAGVISFHRPRKSRNGFIPIQLSGPSLRHLPIPSWCEIKFNGKTAVQIDTPDSLIQLKSLINGLKP